MRDRLFRKGLVLAIIISFIGMSVFPSTAINSMEKTLMPTNLGKIIVVDNEGDGEYTSIKEAVINASEGDTIKVYSGFYEEQRMNILEKSISLIGIPYELGNGNDTGKPFIDGKAEILFWVKVDNFCLKNFFITNKEDIIFLVDAHNCLIVDNILTNSQGRGIYCDRADGSKIFNNSISNVKNGIWARESDSLIISNNVIDNIENCGVHDHLSLSPNYSGNRVTNCSKGIDLSAGFYYKVYNNHIENNKIGLVIWHPFVIKVKYNNFINNDVSADFWKLIYERIHLVRNYWSDWSGIGPKKISGELILFWIPIYPWFVFKIPWVNFDWFPAKEPYDI